MPWLLIYGAVSVVALAVLTLCCARGLRHDITRLAAVVVAAALWPVMVVGLVQYGAVRAFAAYLQRHSFTPVAIEPEPVTAPIDLVDTLARFAQHIGATRPA